ncbi:MAG: vWA domain-containing protein, partial [Candidatus Sericytochromatia bacterium]
MKKNRQLWLGWLVALSTSLSACTAPAFAPGAGRPGLQPGGAVGGRLASDAVGVNAGGAQDIAFARQAIANGHVPSPDTFQVQGLYAEHDLPVGEAPAGKTLHLAFGVGVAPALPQGERAHFVQVGLGSGLSESDLKRPDLKLVVVADRSGSMNGEKIVALRQALKALVDRLTDRDQLGIVIFDDEVDTIRPLGAVTDKQALHRLIDGIEPRGGTDIESGLKRGYEMLEQVTAAEGEDRRVLLLTDAQPNAGKTGPDSFEALISRYGGQGVGLTAFGIGMDFGAALAETIGTQRGGNYVFLKDAEHVRTVFSRDFDHLMTPAAYDLNLKVTPAEGYRIAEVYGASEWKDEQGAYEIKVKTLFFSRNRGAIMLRLAADDPEAAPARVVAKGTLSYLERDRQTTHTD